MSLRRHEDTKLANHIPPHSHSRLEGYPSFADFITQYDAAIFRKYGHLSARNLLYLQSELHELEAELQALDWEDVKNVGDQDAQKAARSWKYYSDEQNTRAKKHRKLQDSIREKIREYRTCRTRLY